MHRAPRLFIPEAGRYAADERCACGHGRSAHNDRLAAFGALVVDVPGHGRCTEPGCPCGRFRWAAWVFAPRRARAVRRRPACTAVG